MQKLYKYANKTISLDLPKEINIIELKQQLPSIEILNNFHHIDISICFIQSDKNIISFNLNALHIYAQWNDSWLTDLPHLLYSYLKYILFHQSIYSIHSCLIDTNLFIGHSGSGKTTLCIHSLENNKTVYSFDRTLLNITNNKLNFIQGTDILSVRKEEKQPSLPISTIHNDRIVYSPNLVQNTKSPIIEKIILFQISADQKIKKLKNYLVFINYFHFL